MRLLPLLLLAAGCATNYMTVDRHPGLQGSWAFDGTTLDVTGSTATLGFLGRLFVFEDVSWLRGRLGKDEVALSGEKLRIRADRSRIVIRDAKASADRAIDSLPAGARFAWRDGALQPR